MAGGERRLKTWLWVLGAVIVALAIALVVVLVTRDDDDSSPTTTTTTSSTTTSSTRPASTTAAPPTTAAPTTAPPTTVPLPPITSDPQSYAMYLYGTWQNDNRTAAANVASADAVNQMFSKVYPASGPYTFSNCNPAAGTLYCTWNGASGATIQMAVRTLTGGLPIQVQTVTFSP